MSDDGYADISGDYAPVFVGWEAKTMSWAAPRAERLAAQTGADRLLSEVSGVCQSQAVLEVLWLE